MIRCTLAVLMLLAPLPAGAATTVHVLGSFNFWQTSLFDGPGMTLENGVWRDTISIPPLQVDEGFQQFKLVTDRAWDVPPDYVLCPDRLDEYQRLSGPVCLIAYGLNLQMYADVPGTYEMRLDESAMTYSATLIAPFTARVRGAVSFAPGSSGGAAPPVATIRLSQEQAFVIARTASDPATGQFELDRLEGGTYFLSVTAPGYGTQEIPGVVVAPGGSVDLGTVVMQPACTTEFTGIQIVGDFNAWNTAVASMTFRNCVWEDTLDVAAGCHYLKFRTNFDWGDDFGTCTAQDPTCTTPLSGTACRVNGESALGKISIPATEAYVFRLNEYTGEYQIVPLATPVRRTSWGRLKVMYR